MNFDKAWLSSNDSVPPEHETVVRTARQFINDQNYNDLVSAICSIEDQSIQLAIIEVLIERKEGKRLASLRTGSPSKPVRKALGKALHKMKTQGIDCQLSDNRTGGIAYSTTPLPSFMATPLATGVRMLILSGRPLGYDMSCYAVVHETDGVYELASINEPSLTRLRRIMTSIEQDNHDDLTIRFVEANDGLVRERIKTALESHQTAGKPMPNEYSLVKDLLAGAPFSGPHPARDLVGGLDASLVRKSAALLGSMGKKHYRQGSADRPFLDEVWLQESSQRIQNASESIVVVDDQQREQRITAEIERIVNDTFDESLRKRSANRLMDTAYILHKTNNPNDAKLAVATADALLDGNQEAINIPWAMESIRQILNFSTSITGHAHGPDHLPHEPNIHSPDSNHDDDKTSLIIKP